MKNSTQSLLKSRWYFSKKHPSEAERNSTTEEHFHRDNDRTAAAMLVREGFQNSLDAKSEGSDVPVRIRIFTSQSEAAVPCENLGEFMTEELRSHIFAPNSGVPQSAKSETASTCPFIVFEDFGTHGLTGDIRANSSVDIKGRKNGFYYFLRAEGANDKTDGSLGSWGVGKTVFPSSSKINTVLIASNRLGDDKVQSVVMARCILNFHSIETSPKCTWRPDGWFGITVPGKDDFVLPCTIADAAGLLEKFRIKRTTESGLTVVVPFVDVEEFTVAKLLDAVLEECCFAIASGKLEVTLEGPSESMTIRATNLKDTLARVLDDQRRTKLSETIKLAIVYASNVPTPMELGRPPEGGALSWNGEHPWFTDAQVKELQSLWDDQKPIRIRIPVPVKSRIDPLPNSVWGMLDVVIARDNEAGTQSPITVRDGLVIPGTSKKDRPLQIAGARAVIGVSKDPLGNVVRDAEDPSHVKLSGRAKRVKNAYIAGDACISFVKLAPAAILRIILGDEGNEDMSILTDLIGLPAPIDQKTKKRPKQTTTTTPTTPQPAGKKPLLTLDRIVEPPGIRCCHHTNGPKDASSFKVKIAYDCDEGNPFVQYEAFDFDLRTDVKIDADRCRWKLTETNVIAIDVEDPEFSITICGFDGRDLCVEYSNVKRRGEND
jgi:hypothetical protein